jgi:hypothetical protein
MKLDKFLWAQELWFQIFWNMPLCWWFSVPWCFWRNVLPSSSRVEGSIPLELLSPWIWNVRKHQSVDSGDIPENMNPKVFLRFIELKLLFQDTLSKQGWNDHLYETLCHFKSVYWHHFHFPCYECATLPGIHSQSLHVLTICETVDLWGGEKHPLKNSDFVWSPLITSISYFTSRWCLNSRF